jgi:hypothetical protein
LVPGDVIVMGEREGGLPLDVVIEAQGYPRVEETQIVTYRRQLPARHASHHAQKSARGAGALFACLAGGLAMLFVLVVLRMFLLI